MNNTPMSASNTYDTQWKEDAKRKLSELTHDMRHPIATFQSFLHILEMQDYKMPPEELKELAQSLEGTLKNSLEKIDGQVRKIKEDWQL